MTFFLHFWNSLYDRIQECVVISKAFVLVDHQLKPAWNFKLMERIGGNWESWDYVHCPQCNLSLILFLSFFISFLNVSFLVKDLFRFTVANEQDQGDKDQDQAGPRSTKAETKLPNSPMTCKNFKWKNSLEFVLDVCCHNNTSNWDKLKFSNCGKVTTKVVNKRQIKSKKKVSVVSSFGEGFFSSP